MEKAIRVISIERGFDPRDFALFSFGGAGGMHAVEIAKQLSMKKVIIPKNAVILSALGLLLADSIRDYSASVLKSTSDVGKSELNRLFQVLERKGAKEMIIEGFTEKDLITQMALDLRYSGQSYEITVPSSKADIENSAYTSKFHKAHQKLYSYHHRERTVEIVNIRLRIVGPSKKIKLKKYPCEGLDAKKAFVKKQEVFYIAKKYTAVVYDRLALTPGNLIHGPALVCDSESTTFLPPSYTLKVDPFLNLIIEPKGSKNG
jgi:N-methylhydantoinase A/oxoprolinase/acetone carboxylase beta subunit